MKHVVYILAVMFLARTPILAQTGPTGTWIVEGAGQEFPWEAVLRADGPNRLLGAVSSCASVRRPIEIFDGNIQGNTISFKCKSVNRQRTVILTGKIRGDEIDFTWELRVAEGGSRGSADGPFGTSAPPRFTAKRAPDAADAVSELANRIRRTPTISFDRILHADREQQNWLTYSGNVLGHRFSPLTQINSSNVKNLELAWLWQAQSQEKFEATPLVVDGVLFTVQAPNDVVAIHAVTGRVIWTYAYTPKKSDSGYNGLSTCCGQVNRGLAISGARCSWARSTRTY